MSEHDDTLLDEDLGDEEYDLGNDEEEALLADDYELERQNSYKGEEETDDVLDLGVTDALDDLDGEDENIEFIRTKTDQTNENLDYYDDEEHQENRSTYYEQDEDNHEYETSRQYEEHESNVDSVNGSSNAVGKGDLREKLHAKNMQKVYVGNGQGLEDDDCEEAKERRNRFQNERTIISPKMNNVIPDTLENVVTPEPSKSSSSLSSSFRGRGRGRGARPIRGGRFNIQNAGNFNPRFSIRNTNFENQPSACRPPLLEARPPFLLGVPPNNIQHNNNHHHQQQQQQQLIYQQQSTNCQPFQQHYNPSHGPPQAAPHFIDNRPPPPPFGPNQYQGPRLIGPRIDYGARLQGPAGATYNCPPSHQVPYVQVQPFQTSMQNNQGPLLQGNHPGGSSLLVNPGPLVTGPGGGTTAPLLQGNQTLPMQQGFTPRQLMPAGSSINHPNIQISSNQSPFENRPQQQSQPPPPAPFQDSQFENRPVYDSRSGYTDQVSNSQFNSNTLPVSQQSTSNVPLPPGHKILINPHFRGAVQPTSDARLAWDSAQQQTAPLSSQISANQFTPYQNQGSYNQLQQGPSSSSHYQQNKSDDPYAYFSDVWQENKPQKNQTASPNKSYPSESNYQQREANYDCVGAKYKSDIPWEHKAIASYQEDHRAGGAGGSGVRQNYHDKDLPSKMRNDSASKNRSLSYRNDYELNNHRPKSPCTTHNRSINVAVRGISRLPPKRIVPDSIDRPPPFHDLSPKRVKLANRNLQQVRTVDTLNETSTSENKDEDNDPEMQEYKKKMEEQKRLREKILREKENRRKMAALEKQNEEPNTGETNTISTSVHHQDPKPVSVLMAVVKDASKSHPGIGRGRGRSIATHPSEIGEKTSGMRIVRTIQTVQQQLNDSVDSGINKKDSNSGHAGQTSDTVTHARATASQCQPGTRRVVIQKPLTCSQKIATTIQRTVSNLQKGQQTVQNKIGNSTTPGNFKKLIIGHKSTNAIDTQRIVTQRVVSPTTSQQRTLTTMQELTNASVQKVVVNTQNNQRVVLQKTLNPQKKLPEIKTNTVRLENLAASTSEAQITRMCQGIGTIESIQMGERSATIVFKTQSAATVFHKKYQRKMLDLSLITVRLVPQSGGTSKATTPVVSSS